MIINKLAQTGVFAIVLAASVSSLAKPSTDDFNSMIQENQATQKELSKKLEKQLKPQKLSQADLHPNFQKVGEEQLGRGTSENVVAPSGASGSSKRTVAQKARQSDLDKKNFKRLSEELKDIK